MSLRGGSTTEVTTQNPFVVIFGQNDRQQNENKQTSHLFVVVLSLLFLMSRFFCRFTIFSEPVPRRSKALYAP
jgi:hypothetical protein